MSNRESSAVLEEGWLEIPLQRVKIVGLLIDVAPSLAPS